jgi:hypothetical protein
VEAGISSCLIRSCFEKYLGFHLTSWEHNASSAGESPSHSAGKDKKKSRNHNVFRKKKYEETVQTPSHYLCHYNQEEKHSVFLYPFFLKKRSSILPFIDFDNISVFHQAFNVTE